MIFKPIISAMSTLILIDVSIRKNALKTAESYKGRAPSKTDIFTEGKAGKVIKFTCWIGSSVTVPAL